jgi:predicted ATPase
LQELLLATRLLTLTGPGGTGKTRLSLALAADVLSRFPDGVCWVPLAPISDPDLVAPTIAQALALHEVSSRPVLERIIDFLAEKQALLLLDNFEQILPAAPVVAELLRATGQARFVITSRAPLHIRGEQEYPVPPLPVPDLTMLPSLDSLSQYEAVQLFIERAMAVRPDFKITTENAPAVAEICARLDGLPLAIELAAARIKLLPPAAILARLGHRLEALGGGARDLPDRQRTLRGAIDWSHELLDEPHRRLFARFGVFVGGATLEAAEAVCGPADGLGVDVLDGLGDLVDHSLVRQSSEAEEPRFQMLETIREYALERLDASGEATEMRRRHAEVQRELVEGLIGGIFSPQQKAILDRYQREHDDIRAAMSWAEEVGDAETALRIGTSMWRFWQMRGHLREGRARLQRALELPATGLDPRIRARALDALGGILYWESDMDRARQTYLQSLAIFRDLADERGTAEELYNAAMAVGTYGREASLRGAEGKAEAEESRALFQRLGDEAGVMRATWALGSMEISVDERASARAHLEEALAMARARADPFHQGWSLFMLAVVDEREADLAAMREHLAGALGIFIEADDSSGYNLVLDGFAWLAWRQGSRKLAMRLSGFSDALQARTGSRLATLNRADIAYFDPEAERADPILDAEWQVGQRLSLDEAVACALSVPGSPPSDPAVGPLTASEERPA